MYAHDTTKGKELKVTLQIASQEIGSFTSTRHPFKLDNTAMHYLHRSEIV